MDGLLPAILSVIAVLVLVVANGFFVAAEFAIVRSHPTKLRSPELYRKFGVRSALCLIEDLDITLSATQLGITIASLLLGWWGELTFASLVSRFVGWLGEPMASLVSHAVATVCALIVITVLHVVVGELAAKSLAIRYPEETLRYVAIPMRAFNIVLSPVVVFLTYCANLLLQLFGLDTPAHAERFHTSAELAMLISQSGEQGIIDKDEEEMLQGVFGFSNTVAREVMTPRTDLVVIRSNASLEEIVKLVSESGYSRFPVIEGTIDDVIGILMSRDILPLAAGYTPSNGENFDVRKVMREPYFIPETKPIDDLLKEFQSRKVHMAIVLDEHGGVDGAVTLEDLIEEIVGEIYDESDVAELELEVQEGGDILMDGGFLVGDLNDKFQLELPPGDYDTVAGLILNNLGRMPRLGDKLLVYEDGKLEVKGAPKSGTLPKTEANGSEELEAEREDKNTNDICMIFLVEKLNGRRIERVRLTLFKSDKLPESPESIPASEVEDSTG